MKRLLKTVGLALAGALMGYIFGNIFDPGSIMYWTWFFAGVPFGWSFLGRHFGHLISTNLLTTMFFFVMRVALAGLLGWILIPVEVIHSLIEFFSGTGE